MTTTIISGHSFYRSASVERQRVLSALYESAVPAHSGKLIVIMSNRKLGRRCGISRRAAIRHVCHLVDDGHLTRVSPPPFESSYYMHLKKKVSE